MRILLNIKQLKKSFKFPIKLSNLMNKWIAFINAVDQGSSNWGPRDWEKKSEMQQQIEVKTFFFFFF